MLNLKKNLKHIEALTIKKVNKWISLKIADNQHLVSNGISICNPIAGGTIESERETWVNYQKIKNILINEYWIFLQELDLVFNRSIKYAGGDENKLAQFFMTHIMLIVMLFLRKYLHIHWKNILIISIV